MNVLSHLPGQVRVVEVGPRDGLQNEVQIISTRSKARYVELLADAGLRAIEVTSFVSPKRVPQLADAAELFGLLAPRPGVCYSALVPNERGLERALAAGVRAIALFTAASDSFTRHNIGMSVEESLETFRSLMSTAKTHQLEVRGYVSTAFVCPYEGIITVNRVTSVVQALLDMGVEEISLGDTIGHAVPTQVVALSDALEAVAPLNRFAWHFHDTHGLALANVLTALQCGATIFDAASGGLGGCPFAPGAAGNLATEDLIGLLDGLRIETGVDLQKLAAASRFLEQVLGRSLPGKRLQSIPISGAL